MPRPWELSVEPFPPRTSSHWHRCRVIGAGESRAPAGLLVTLEDQAGDQRDRHTSTVLGLPRRPTRVTPDFFIACGIDATEGKRINPATAAGTRVLVRFACKDGGTVSEPAAFAPVPRQENSNEQQSATT